MSKIEAIQKLQFSQDQRIITCDTLYKGWKSQKPSQRGAMKPDGMWWGMGSSWIDWCIAEETGWLGRFIYEVKVDESKILRVKTLEEFDAFEERFGGEDIYGGYFTGFSTKRFNGPIKWQEVAELYSGVEIAPYLWERRLKSLWYYGWDIASGVIWDKSALLSRILRYTYNPEEDIYERHD